MGCNFIQNISQAVPVDATDRVRSAQAKVPELKGLGHAHRVRLALVDCKVQGHMAVLAKPVSNRDIHDSEAFLSVADKYRRGGFLQCEQRLVGDLVRKYVFGVFEHNTTGVHHLKVVVVPVACAVRAVARDTRFVVDNRSVLGIEKRLSL